ncbi:hypothetical protein [Clostridium beijerinckii]|uniref:Uncharacterized protein n=1 Tax=Clostridium beijerinckii TaxID=1520 RepID=A0A9Q5CWH1_CLOBE|nr:hypothetical protein [Clostridium beijerinckii]AQS05946.1 hypothetical protein CLBIJ_33890 [Clostridium beijerinckii]MBA2888146.1 hypothetical protein [Clostridium beijerinckii]MBA2902834.1 hypothetical protein [Clostridium beijerinckii]MBA2912660.1 hypothetical protein [Clostridium beijerinckii]MBA9014451.1 hypothetical protein [Clostridium beijerinckii]
MIDKKDIIDIAIALVKDSEYKKANRLIIGKMNQVLEKRTKGDREKIKELNKEIFMLNRTIDKYIFKLKEIKGEVSNDVSLNGLEDCLVEIQNERERIIAEKRNVSFSSRNY